MVSSCHSYVKIECPSHIQEYNLVLLKFMAFGRTILKKNGVGQLHNSLRENNESMPTTKSVFVARKWILTRFMCRRDENMSLKNNFNNYLFIISVIFKKTKIYFMRHKHVFKFM